MDNKAPKHSPRFLNRLPPRRWLFIVGAVLALWAVALGVWWVQLRQTSDVTPIARATRPPSTVVDLATPEADTEQTPTSEPQGTPVTMPVTRTAGEWVRSEDWLAMARAFDEERALADIAELTGAKYAGRAVGSPGGKLAAEWIAERFAEYGLQPAGDNGTYYQEFPVPNAELTAMPSFQLIDDLGQTLEEYQFRSDYTIWLGGYTDGGQAEGPVIWVSNGTHDDYDGIDAEGAIVICRLQPPTDEVLRQALEHGAEALLLIYPEDIYFRMRRTAREDPLLPEGIPTLLVSNDVAIDLLKGSGLTLDDLTIQYRSRTLATRARINVPLQYQEQVTGRNVLGVLPGSDPDGMNQIVIVGGHYDHMGADPDGTAWVGANDDASGVSVLLEIARQWQEQGYVPKRTVLFAAWDGEEIGLYGSIHYVEHPRYPLHETAGMIQLDMVGAGTPILAIDAGGLVVDQSLAAAAQLGIAMHEQSLGRSDHAPFVGAGVPATVYIWWNGDAPGLIYHVPEDDISNIEPDKLDAAGQLTNLVLLNLSWEQEELEDLATVREEAIASRDMDSLLRTVGPWDERLLREQETWFESLLACEPAEFTVTVGSPIVAADVATSTTTIHYRWEADDTRATVQLPERWVRRDLAWYYAGPAWDQVQSDHSRILHLQAPDVAVSLAQRADAVHGFLTNEVGLTVSDVVTVRFYSKPQRVDDLALPGTGSQDLLYALHIPSSSHDGASGWPTDDGIVLSEVDDLPTVLTEFALQHAGWPTTTVSWLAQGLIEHWEATEPQVAEELEREYMPLLLQADNDGALWTLEGMPSRHQLQRQERDLWAAQAWGMTHYLLQADGWAALQQPTALDVGEWRTALLGPWHAASQGIRDTLEKRSTAVLGADKVAFMATVDPTDSVLYQEESHWFDDLEEHPADEFAYRSELFSLDEDQATVDLTVAYSLQESHSGSTTVGYEARFVHRDGRWLYADINFTQESSEHFVLKYEHPQHALHAQALLAAAERAYAQVTADLDFAPTQPIEIKVYDQRELFSFSIYLSMIPAHGWTEPGESIKSAIPTSIQVALDAEGATIAHELTHAALFSKGVQHSAVHEGTAQYEAAQYSSQWVSTRLIKWRRDVYDLVRSKRPLTLKDLADWREVAPEDRGLLYTMGWDTVTYFRERYGRGPFLEWLRLLATDVTFDEAFFAATGTSFTDFDAEWRESVLRGHVDERYIQTALSFDEQRALEHVRTLSQPAWCGRETGTPGNEAAAQYIADRFAEYGLQVAGDAGSYFQEFSQSQTTLITTPVLSILAPDGQPWSLGYRVDFRELIGGCAGSGQAESEVLYVKNPRDEDLRLGGRVLLTRGGEDPWQDAQDALARGAGALLLTTNKWTKDLAPKMIGTPQLSSETIPVFELTKEASDSLLELAGYKPWQLENVPPALPLPLSARAEVQLATTPTVRVANVLGVLPGSDPQVADEILILGAHLDHVGRLPDGTVYPGANNDASGAAVLLEIARLWHEQGYRPRRTVLFAAWNAAELGLKGSSHYVAHPAYPLADTVAVIQLDMVGQGRGFYINAFGSQSQDAAIIAHLDRAAQQVESRMTFSQYEATSDHAPFHGRGVPSVVLTWEDPDNAHTPQDTVETIDEAKLYATGRVTALALMIMAQE